MTIVDDAGSAPDNNGVVKIRRSTAKLLVDIVRNPLTALPAACYSERLVIARSLGIERVYISDPALVHETIVRNADRLEKDQETKRVLGPGLGNGLLTSDGPVWRWQRQTVASAFQHDRLKALLPAMIDAAEATRERWLARPAGSAIEIRDEMMRTTFAIIVETMLSGSPSFDAAGIEQKLGSFLGATSWMFALALLRAPLWVPFPGKAKATAATHFMRDAVRATVAERRAQIDRCVTGEGERADLITMLLAAADPETGRKMSDEEITDNIVTFITAGHETTAVALTWTFSVLSDHPEAADAIAAEVETVTGGGPLQPDHVAALTYTRQVINEVMRLYPPAPMIARRVVEDIEIGGVRFAPGTVLFVPVYAIHRHTVLWREPEAFRPERFTPEATRTRHRFAFMPFGAGPRICIGNAFAMMEAAAILAVLVRAMRLTRVDPAPPEPLARVTLRPRQTTPMRILRR